MLSVTSPKEGTITKHNIEKTESQTNNIKLVARVRAYVRGQDVNSSIYPSKSK